PSGGRGSCSSPTGGAIRADTESAFPRRAVEQGPPPLRRLRVRGAAGQRREAISIIRDTPSLECMPKPAPAHRTLALSLALVAGCLVSLAACHSDHGGSVASARSGSDTTPAATPARADPPPPPAAGG